MELSPEHQHTHIQPGALGVTRDELTEVIEYESRCHENPNQQQQKTFSRFWSDPETTLSTPARGLSLCTSVAEAPKHGRTEEERRRVPTYISHQIQRRKSSNNLVFHWSVCDVTAEAFHRWHPISPHQSSWEDHVTFGKSCWRLLHSKRPNPEQFIPFL